ncbi:hypothetical protein [uncultured Sphingomonas sp.]|uniref:hypothetical protein n=1 Tax=uncultured Sphingomonas sp. TaxID=158754 RepID=UPI0035CC3FA3
MDKSDPRNVTAAAQECHGIAANISLTSNHAIDNRPFWLSVLRGHQSKSVFNCLDRWSAEYLGTRAELVDALPEREISLQQALSILKADAGVPNKAHPNRRH